MGQPITLYRVADGEPCTFYGAHYTAELVASGEYSLSPVMVIVQDTPTPLAAVNDVPQEKPARPRTRKSGL